MKYYKEIFLALYINISTCTKNSILLPERYPKNEKNKKIEN